MKFKWLISLGLVVCLVMAFCLPMCAPAPPAEEELAKSINAYMGFSPEGNEAIVDCIKEGLGVEVRQTFMSWGEIGAKLKAEAPNFGADMCISVGSTQAHTAKKEGWSVSYASPPWQGAGDVWVDSDNYWVSMGASSSVVVGNKDLLAEKGYTMPDSYEDLLDPKWKGQIVTPSPMTSGTAWRILYGFMWLYGFNADKGEEGGWEYLEKLDKNIHHYTESGGAPLELVCRGEFLLGMTNDGDIYARIKEGYPVVMAVPKEGFSYDADRALILKGTKELYTCQKIIDFCAGHDMAVVYAQLGNLPMDPTAVNPLYELYGRPKYIPNIDLGWTAENKERLVNEWKNRIGRPAE